MTLLLLFFIILFASFTQSLAGFGSALIAMPLLANLLGLQIAAPLVAMVVLVLEVVLLIRYRQALNMRVVWKLIVSSLVGIPLGILFFSRIEESIMLSILGFVIIAYALYALINFRLPELQHPIWAFVFGFFAGLLGGAYNTAGPPVIIFGNSRRWEPAEFKANLQGFFLATSLWILASHAIRGNITADIWTLFLPSILAIALGVWAGLMLDQRIDSRPFGRIVLWLLLLLGVSLFL